MFQKRFRFPNRATRLCHQTARKGMLQFRNHQEVHKFQSTQAHKKESDTYFSRAPTTKNEFFFFGNLEGYISEELVTNIRMIHLSSKPLSCIGSINLMENQPTKAPKPRQRWVMVVVGWMEVSLKTKGPSTWNSEVGSDESVSFLGTVGRCESFLFPVRFDFLNTTLTTEKTQRSYVSRCK